MTTYSIAQIIQAEAATPEGQFAVASTIFNRSRSPLFGSSNPLDIANAPGQFAGHLGGSNPGFVPAHPSAFAQQLADAVQNGNLSDYGDPGNALYFQSNQGQPSTVVGGRSAYIGGNYFTDQFGQPSANFQAPSFGSTPSNSNMFDGNSGLMNGSDAFGSGGAGASSIGDGSFVSDNNPFGDTFGGTQSPESLGGPAKPVAGGDTGIPGISSQGTGTFNDMTASPSQTSDNPIQPTAKAGSGASAGTAPQGKDKGNDSGAKLDVTNAPAIGSDAANTLSQALGGVTQGAASDTKSLEGTGTGWLNSIFSGATSLLVRGGLIMAGLFLLLGAFVFFYADSQASKKG